MLTDSLTAPPPTTFRKKRFAFFWSFVDGVLANKGQCHILDVGGSDAYWRAYGGNLLDDKRISITVLNLPEERSGGPWPFGCRFERVEGDARSMPQYGDGTFDIAHSNSVIEHVGRWMDMLAMAREVQRVGDIHYVQTPYFGFPIEPHTKVPLLQYIPERLKYRLHLVMRMGFYRRAQSVSQAMELTQHYYLLDRRQFAALFPTSTIYSEMIFGLTKSLVAVGGKGLAVQSSSNTRRLRTLSHK